MKFTSNPQITEEVSEPITKYPGFRYAVCKRLLIKNCHIHFDKGGKIRLCENLDIPFNFSLFETMWNDLLSNGSRNNVYEMIKSIMMYNHTSEEPFTTYKYDEYSHEQFR